MSVYSMRMARINVYLPDDLADRVKRADINVSSVTQEALRRALGQRDTEDWLDQLSSLPATGVAHGDVIEAVRGAREELGHRGG